MGGGGRGFRRGMITSATVVLYSVLILAILIASSTAFRYLGSLYMREKLPMETVILLHRAVVEACSSGYGSVKVEIFVPPGSRVIFYGSELTVEGVDMKREEAEGIWVLVNSIRSDPISVKDVVVQGNALSLRYRVKLNDAERPVSFEGKVVVPSGLWSVTLVCKTFDSVSVRISPSG
jgi:hypothetical protein